MRILLADDHALMREGLRHVLRRLEGEVTVVETADCSQMLEVVEQQSDFDIALLDIAMPGMDGLDGLECLRERLPSTPIVMLSAAEDPKIVREAFRRGAQGFIPKSSTGDVMLSAMRLVLSGGVYLPPSLLRWSDSPADDPSLPNEIQHRTDGQLNLTQRQREVLTLIVTGKTNKEIARTLNMSETTVRTHATAIFKILNVTNRTQAGHVAAKCGFGQGRA